MIHLPLTDIDHQVLYIMKNNVRTQISRLLHHLFHHLLHVTRHRAQAGMKHSRHGQLRLHLDIHRHTKHHLHLPRCHVRHWPRSMAKPVRLIQGPAPEPFARAPPPSYSDVLRTSEKNLLVHFFLGVDGEKPLASQIPWNAFDSFVRECK